MCSVQITPKVCCALCFYGNGKYFCLTVSSEHRDLRLSQIQQTENGYRYTENSSIQKLLWWPHSQNKSVEIYRNSEAGDRCHCRVFDLHISKLPCEAKDKDLFYVHPMEKPNSSTPTYKRSAWYYSIPVGHNKLAQTVPEVCKLENILRHKMNHSLRATGGIELYKAEVPEKNHPRENWSPFTRMFTYI